MENIIKYCEKLAVIGSWQGSKKNMTRTWHNLILRLNNQINKFGDEKTGRDSQ